MSLAHLTTTEASVRSRLERRGRDWSGAVFRIATFSMLFVSVLVLVILLVTVFSQGWSVLSERGLDFITSGTAGSPEEAGVWQGLVGSALLGLFVVVLAFPLGIGAAVYLEEYAPDTHFTRFIDVNIRNLAGVPSIVYGILGFAVFVSAIGTFSGGASVVAGGLTLSVLVLPIIVITAAEALRAVPRSIREAGFGVGATKWEVIRSHVLPYAAPGIITGTILSLARALGEAAPLILVGAKTGFFALPDGASFSETIQGPFTALPIQIFDWAKKPGDGWPELTAAAIIVMLALVLAANTAAVLLRNHFDKQRT